MAGGGSPCRFGEHESSQLAELKPPRPIIASRRCWTLARALLTAFTVARSIRRLLTNSLAVGRRAGRVGRALVTLGEGAGFDGGCGLYPAGGGQPRMGAVTDSDAPDPPSAKVVASLLRDARSLSRSADKLDSAAAVADSTTRQLAAGVQIGDRGRVT